jgi:cytochrome c-type biogenesis protein CcmF
VTIFGIAAMTAWQQEDIRVADIGDRWNVGQFEFQLDNVNQLEGPNYMTTMADISVWRGARQVGDLHPEKRFYPVANMPTTEAAIINGVLRDIYVVVGDPQESGGWAVRIYLKPFANWIWGGAMLMALGGCFSLSDRRLRVGASSAKKTPKAVPAE